MEKQELTEEEELQAAIMARIAQRAELLAAEKNGASTTAPSSVSTRPKAPIDKRPANGHSQVPIKSSTTKKEDNNKNNTREANRFTNNKRGVKRFKFEWDESEDTAADLDQYNLPVESDAQSDRLLKLVDERTSKNGKSQKVWTDVMDKPLAEMTDRDWHFVREKFDIRVRGRPIPPPARTWDEMNLPSHLRMVIAQIGYAKPTPIQMQAIPIGLGPTDVIGVAETGSGKTCAFVMPLLVRLSKEPWLSRRNKCAEDGPLALILGPTRELVNQIEEEVSKLGSLDPMPVRSCAVIGGTSAEDQGFRLREGCDVVVATPGRLIDLLASHVAVLNQCNYIVLDEADRMIDMGFENQVNKILDSLVARKEDRTTFLFSATMPAEVVAMAERYMKTSKIIIRVGDEGDAASRNKNIEQNVYVLPSKTSKEGQLRQILAREEPPIIVFCNAKNECDLLVRQLRSNGKRAVALHAGRNQDEREENLRKFKEGVHDILVATDVAGRGLDVEGVSHVINYDCPNALDRYCHRIGRTGRAGRSGRASTFIVRGVDEPAVVTEIAQFMKKCGQRVPPEMAEITVEAEGMIDE